MKLAGLFAAAAVLIVVAAQANAENPQTSDSYARMQAREQLNAFCNARHTVAVEAISYKASGWSIDATEDQLVREFAYGPSGQVYRNSAGAEAMVRGVVAAVYYPTPGLNDSYGTQRGYLSCLSGN